MTKSERKRRKAKRLAAFLERGLRAKFPKFRPERKPCPKQYSSNGEPVDCDCRFCLATDRVIGYAWRGRDQTCAIRLEKPE